MVNGNLWQEMSRQPRCSLPVTPSDVPESPGVYALYRDDAPVYVELGGLEPPASWGRAALLPKPPRSMSRASELSTQ